VAHKTGAISTTDLERVTVDTTVQLMTIAHPTNARLVHRVLEKLVGLAKREGVQLRQSYIRVAKRTALLIGRYAHTHQFRRVRKALKFLRTRLGRVIRYIRRKTAFFPALADRFEHMLRLVSWVPRQDQRTRAPKVYALHAPEVECIGEGKAVHRSSSGARSVLSRP